jgi:hypothetical protein
MPHDALAKAKAEAHIRNLRAEKTTKITLSDAQLFWNVDRTQGRAQWCAALREHRQYELGYEESGGKKAKSAQDSKGLLDLPPETRNHIYKYYLETTDGLYTKHDMRLGRKTTKNMNSLVALSLNDRDEISVRRLMIKKGNDHVENYRLMGDARAAFDEYKAAYTMNLEERPDCEKQRKRGSVRINERGNLCEDLPSLALTCHQVLGELWGMYFWPKKGDAPDHAVYTARVKNFDFFPLFRFLQMLHCLPDGSSVRVPGKLVDIVLEDDPQEVASSDTKYCKIKKLIELHWLEGLPLWGCLTGMREEKGIDEKPPEEVKAKREFWKWMDGVRHVVELYHFNPEEWRKLSVKYLKRWAASAEKKQRSWAALEDGEVVDEAIELLTDAIEYRCGFIGSWGYGEEDQLADPSKGYFLHSKPTRNAYEVEHSVVHLANQFYVEVKKTVEKELDSCYQECMTLDDEKFVPKRASL